MQSGSIYYLTRNQIDQKLWDACIDRASNGLIYSYTTYLDTMADHWDGLILDEYKAVMPLPWRKKYGIYYLYQPAFVAQLGLFGNNITSELLLSFLNSVPAKFKYWEFSLNHHNLFSCPGYVLQQRTNFVLSLNQPYEVLYSQYRDNIKRNVKKANGYGCYIKKDIEVAAIIELAKPQALQSGITQKDLTNFSLLYASQKKISRAVSYGVFSNQHQLLASAVFFFSHNRTYYILVGNHPNGRTLGASHSLIDAFIKDHQGQNLFLDFEGSDLGNLAFFYSSFGATEEKYPAIKLNRLPWYTRWIKK